MQQSAAEKDRARTGKHLNIYHFLIITKSMSLYII